MKKMIRFLVCVMLLIMIPLSAAAEEITLAWDENPGAKVAGYRIYYSRSSGRYDKEHVVDVGKVNHHTIELASGQWYFVITAYDSQGSAKAHIPEK